MSIHFKIKSINPGIRPCCLVVWHGASRGRWLGWGRDMDVCVALAARCGTACSLRQQVQHADTIPLNVRNCGQEHVTCSSLTAILASIAIHVGVILAPTGAYPGHSHTAVNGCPRLFQWPQTTATIPLPQVAVSRTPRCATELDV